MIQHCHYFSDAPPSAPTASGFVRLCVRRRSCTLPNRSGHPVTAAAATGVSHVQVSNDLKSGVNQGQEKLTPERLRVFDGIPLGTGQRPVPDWDGPSWVPTVLFQNAGGQRETEQPAQKQILFRRPVGVTGQAGATGVRHQLQRRGAHRLTSDLPMH